MWTCPRCGREFTRTNQGHYCGKAPDSVDEYTELQTAEAQAYITELRKIIVRCVPDVKERIAWSMPFFHKGNCSVSFAACKNHISLYIDQAVIERIRPQLDEFAIKKNAIYLAYDRALPIQAIEDLIRQCFESV